MKYILSNFYNNVKNNLNYINSYFKTYNIVGIQESISFNISSGWYNNNGLDMTCLYPSLMETLAKYPDVAKNRILFDFGNLILSKKYFDDCLNEVLLNEFVEQKNCYFEVANLDFIDYLTQNYPSIQIILHQNLTMFSTEEEVQSIIDKYPKNIKGIIVTNLNFCPNINLEKYYLLTLNLCENCVHFKDCILADNQFKIDYSKRSAFNDCSLKGYKSYEQIKETINICKENNLCDYILLDNYISKNKTFENKIISTLFEGEAL